MKKIHAKYCDKFVQAYLEDGTILHLQLNSERCRQYEDRVKTALGQMERRLACLLMTFFGIFLKMAELNVYLKLLINAQVALSTSIMFFKILTSLLNLEG